MQKITPFLWFDDNAEAAVKFYASVFKGTKVLATSYYPTGTPGKAGTVMTINFRLLGQEFVALNGGPNFQFNEAVSFFVKCRTQAEIDRYWRKLSAGGRKIECGWLQDKFGVFWQVVPEDIDDLIASGDAARTERVMGEVMKMQKLDLKRLRAAAKGKRR